MGPQAILLDFDGTLVDTAPDFIDALNRLLAERGHPEVPQQAFRNLAGDGAKRLFLRALEHVGAPLPAEAELMPEVQRLIAYYYEVMTVRTRPFPGVVETLRGLRAGGARLAVCTNKPQASTDALIRHFGLEALFDAVLGGDTVRAKKPDPLHLHDALARLGRAPGQAVMVGDSATDVAAARAAAVPVVVVAYGYSPVPAHALGGDAVIGHFAELPAALARLFGPPA
jgi:phosphoglycolate phosphatase